MASTDALRARTPSGTTTRRLARCHGFAVAAGGRPVGSIETPVFAGAAPDPDHLIVRTDDGIPGTFRVVPAALIEGVDPVERLVMLAVDRDGMAALPERLPLGR